MNQWERYKPAQLDLHPGVSRYDMLLKHHVFNSSIMQHFHQDVFKFTIITDPVHSFVSSVNFFGNHDKMSRAYLRKMPGPDKVANFLEDPEKYEVHGIRSATDNRQSMDLGYDNRKHKFNDSAYIGEFIKQLDSFYDVVLITEYFHESVVLLKRLLRWSTGDILYFHANKAKKGRPPPLTEEQLRQHRRISVADRALYDHFLKVFQYKISRQPGLAEEVEEFEDILEKVSLFCEGFQNNSTKELRQLIIPPGQWTDQVSILSSKCDWLNLPGPPFVKYDDCFKSRQRSNFTINC